MRTEIAVEIGSQNLRIFQKGIGLVFCEPTLLSVKQRGRKLVCTSIGNDTLKLVGETDDEIIQPIKEGAIINYQACKLLLSKVLNKLFGKKFALNKIKAVLCISTGLTKSEKDELLQLFFDCGIGEVSLVPVLLCIANLIDNSSSAPHFIVDIGAGKTEIGIVTNMQVVNAFTISVGGQLMDIGISEYFKMAKSFTTSPFIIQALKESIGSLFTSDSASQKIWGMNLKDEQPKQYTVSAREFYQVLDNCYDKIAVAIKALLSDCDPTLSKLIVKQGIVYAGDGCKILGFEKYMQDKLHIKALVCDAWGQASVEGAATLLEKIESTS